MPPKMSSVISAHTYSWEVPLLLRYSSGKTYRNAWPFLIKTWFLKKQKGGPLRARLKYKRENMLFGLLA